MIEPAEPGRPRVGFSELFNRHLSERLSSGEMYFFALAAGKLHKETRLPGTHGAQKKKIPVETSLIKIHEHDIPILFASQSGTKSLRLGGIGFVPFAYFKVKVFARSNHCFSRCSRFRFVSPL